MEKAARWKKDIDHTEFEEIARMGNQDPDTLPWTFSEINDEPMTFVKKLLTGRA